VDGFDCPKKASETAFCVIVLCKLFGLNKKAVWLWLEFCVPKISMVIVASSSSTRILAQLHDVCCGPLLPRPLLKYVNSAYPHFTFLLCIYISNLTCLIMVTSSIRENEMSTRKFVLKYLWPGGHTHLDTGYRLSFVPGHPSLEDNLFSSYDSLSHNTVLLLLLLLLLLLC
jgi:hypothetical protein